VSISAGVRGANLTYGRGGLYGNAGLPGTGMSFREKIDLTRSSRSSSPGNFSTGNETNIGIQMRLNEDGTVDMLDSAGAPLAPKYVKLAKEQQNEFIQGWLEENCEEWNQEIESVLNIHLGTPPADFQVKFEAIPFEQGRPQKPAEVKPGFFGKFFKGPQLKAEVETLRLNREHEAALAQWSREKSEHERCETLRKELIETTRYKAPEGMQDFLSEVLSDIEWPRETLVSFEVTTSGKEVFLDVDFPEIGDMPTEHAVVASRGIRINRKQRSEIQCRKDYMHHVHAILFRLIGEAFAALPTVEEVIASGFSQRNDQQTGHVIDEYLLSTKVRRDQWEKINFLNIKALVLTDSFEQFELRRRMTKTGVFAAIQPFGESLNCSDN
jgi:hypothetical protein